MSEEITTLGGAFYIARGQESYLGNGAFTQSWQLVGETVQDAGPITADVIYDKGSFISDETVPVLNSKRVNEICSDKWITYQLFSTFCPKTIRVNEQSELAHALEKITGSMLVSKSLAGFEGANVFVGSRVDFEAQQETLAYPLLLQEFIDSSVGIPGLVEGTHDFRIAILDGEILMAYVRTPPTGSLKANYSLGGSYANCAITDIPESFLEVVTYVESKMEVIGSRFYTIDLALTASGPKIIELNSRMGMSTKLDAPVFIIRLSEKLIAMANGH